MNNEPSYSTRDDEDRPTPGTKRRKKFQRSSKACTYCRHKKLKCDAVERFPNACSQCERSKHYCEIDSGHIGPAKMPQHIPPASKTSERSKNNDQSRNGCYRSGAPVFLAEWYPFIKDTTPLPDETFGDVTIPGTTLRRMMRTFYDHFYHHMPIFVREYMDPAMLGGVRRGVYLAILSVTSAVECPEYEEMLHNATTDEISKLRNKMITWPFSIDPQAGLSFAMALLVLTTWSIPRLISVQQESTFWVMPAVVQTGLQLGLHQVTARDEWQEFDLDDSRERHSLVASLCWAGIFMANQTHCSFTGLHNFAPLYLGTFQQLNRLSRKVPEFSPLVLELRIWQAIKNGIEALGNRPDTETGMVEPASRGIVHSTVLSTYSQLASELTLQGKNLELLFLFGKLQFHSFMLTPDTLEADQRAAAVSASIVCVKILTNLRELMEQVPHIRTLPLAFQRMSYSAALLILGLLSSEQLSSLIDGTSCKNAVAEMYQLYKQREPDHETSKRLTKVIDAAYEMQQNGRLCDPVFNIRTRLGASPFMSILVKIKRYRQEMEKREAESDANDQSPYQSQPQQETSPENRRYISRTNHDASTRTVRLETNRGPSAPHRIETLADLSATSQTGAATAPEPQRHSVQVSVEGTPNTTGAQFTGDPQQQQQQYPEPVPQPAQQPLPNLGLDGEQFLYDLWDWELPIDGGMFAF